MARQRWKTWPTDSRLLPGDLFEEKISEAPYGDGCETICKAVFLKPLQRECKPKREMFLNGRSQIMSLNEDSIGSFQSH